MADSWAMGARRFRPNSRVALFLAAQGRCAACGEPLRPGWHADHVQPVKGGGRHGAGERPGAVPALQPREGRTAGVIAPRPWQAEFLARHAAHPRPDFLLVATPGPARRSPRRLAIRAANAEQIVVVCPTTALRAQWADAADAVGLHLDPRWRNADGAWRADIDGVVVTYQQVASGAGPVRPPSRAADVRGARRDPSRGRIRDLGDRAARGVRRRAHRLALSGTPFRSDARAIPFVSYDDERRCAPDFVYGYGEAVRDEVCRPLAFRLLDATLRWRVDAQETIAAFADELDATDDARRLRTAIDPQHPAAAADAARRRRAADEGPRCGPRRGRARAVRRPRPRARDRALLRTIAGEKPVVVRQRRSRRRTRGSTGSPGRRQGSALARRGEHGQRGRRRPSARPRRLRHGQAHRPVLPPSRRPGRAPSPERPRRPRGDGLPARRPHPHGLRRARRGRAAPAGQRRGRRRRSTSSRRPGSPGGRTSSRSTRRSSPAA